MGSGGGGSDVGHCGVGRYWSWRRGVVGETAESKVSQWYGKWWGSSIRYGCVEG